MPLTVHRGLLPNSVITQGLAFTLGCLHTTKSVVKDFIDRIAQNPFLGLELYIKAIFYLFFGDHCRVKWVTLALPSPAPPLWTYWVELDLVMFRDRVIVRV